MNAYRWGRILVAIDASPGSLLAARQAIALAEAHGAEVVGLFVEDEDVVRWAALPVATEVCYAAGEIRVVAPEATARALAAHAARARRAFLAAAARHRVKAEFVTSRGSVGKEIARQASDVQLVAAARRGWGTGRPGIGRVARAVAADSPASVVLLARHMGAGPVPAPRVALVSGDGALGSAAADLARELSGDVVVLAPRAAHAGGQSAGDFDPEWPVVTLPGPGPAGIAAGALAASAGVLLMAGDHPLATNDGLEAIARGFRGTIVVAR